MLIIKNLLTQCITLVTLVTLITLWREIFFKRPMVY